MFKIEKNIPICSMTMQTGHEFLANVKDVPGKSISFVDDQGRVVFEVSIVDGEQAIEIRGVNMTKHKGKTYSEQLVVKPRYSNSIHVFKEIYE